MAYLSVVLSLLGGLFLFYVFCSLFILASSGTSLQDLREQHENESADENQRNIAALMPTFGVEFGSDEYNRRMEHYQRVKAANKAKECRRTDELIDKELTSLF